MASVYFLAVHGADSYAQATFDLDAAQAALKQLGVSGFPAKQNAQPPDGQTTQDEDEREAQIGDLADALRHWVLEDFPRTQRATDVVTGPVGLRSPECLTLFTALARIAMLASSPIKPSVYIEVSSEACDVASTTEQGLADIRRARQDTLRADSNWKPGSQTGVS